MNFVETHDSHYCIWTFGIFQEISKSKTSLRKVVLAVFFSKSISDHRANFAECEVIGNLPEQHPGYLVSIG